MASGYDDTLVPIKGYGLEDWKGECPEEYESCERPSIWDGCRHFFRNSPRCDCSANCHKFSSCCIGNGPDFDDKAVSNEIDLNSCFEPLTEPNLQSFMVRSKCSVKWSTDQESNKLIKEMWRKEQQHRLYETYSGDQQE